MMIKRCEYAGGCEREGTRFFQAEPLKRWLCEEHFQQTLNVAAEIEASVRRMLEAAWQEHLDQHLREGNLEVGSYIAIDPL